MKLLNEKEKLQNLEEIYPKYNIVPYKEEFSEIVMNKIINDIIQEYKLSNNYNITSCNTILIFLYYNENNEEKIEWVLKCLEKTSKIYKPIIVLAFKEKKVNVIEKKEKQNEEYQESNLDKDENEENIKNQNIECKIKDNKINNMILLKEKISKQIIEFHENKRIEEKRNFENQKIQIIKEIKKNEKNDKDEMINLVENKTNNQDENKKDIPNDIVIETNEKSNDKNIFFNNQIDKENKTENMQIDEDKKVQNISWEETKKNIIEKKNDDKLNLSEINKSIDVVSYEEGNYMEIQKKLYALYCYFNNISDVYSIINEMLEKGDENNPNRKNLIKYKATFNILVIGRPGGGKSTLINLLLNERKAREGIGLSITRLFSKYVHSKYPITLVDTPGFENNKDLNKMINFLDNVKDFFDNGKNKFHLILYIINASNERCFIGEEVKLISHIYKKLKIPIFFVCTRAKNEEYALDFQEVIKINLLQNFGSKTSLIEHIYCCQLLNEKDGIYKRFGIDTILKSIQDYFKNEINYIKNIEKNFELGNLPKNEIKNFLDNNNDHQIILNYLDNYHTFYDYLDNLSNYIIENYKYLIKEEENKRKKFEKGNKIINKSVNIITNHIINETLVKHLAFELDGDPSIINIKNIHPEPATVICDLLQPWKNKTEDIIVKSKKIKDESIKEQIRITNEIGTEAKSKFFSKLEKKGLNNYLKEIINDYEKAINSLTNLVEDIKNN